MGARGIHQLTAFARHGDAVFDDAYQLRRMFLSWGVDSSIYVLDRNRSPIEGVDYYKKLRCKPDDIVLYHFGIGGKLTGFFLSLPARKFLVYHNMTPEEYLLGIDNNSYVYIRRGRKDLEQLRDRLTGCFADSQYNADDLINRHGYTDVTVAPILKSFEQWEGKEPDLIRMAKWSSDKKTILFIGRIAGNKRQDELIKTINEYARMFGRDVRLVLPGSFNHTRPYRDYLLKLVDRFNLHDLVEIPGFVDDEDIHALYSQADIYLSLSEHEGFGVPFLEAMHFGIPVVALSVCSVPEVLGEAGIKLKHNDPRVTAAVLRQILANEDLKERIVAGQKKRLNDFKRDKIESIFKNRLEPYI